MKEFKVLQQVKDEPSKNGKLKILKDNETDNLKALLEATYNRFKTYRVNQVDLPSEYNQVQPDTFQEFFLLLDKLASHTWGTIAAKAAIKNFLAKNTKVAAEWYVKVIQGDLGAGIDEKGINKAFPDLVPEFKIQKGEPALENWDKIKFPCLVDQKVNGYRCVVFVNNGEVTFRSSNGFEFPCKTGAMTRQILQLAAGRDCVFDSEFYPIKLNPKCKAAVGEYEKGGNQWTLSQAGSMAKSHKFTEQEMEDYIQLKIWDVIPYDYFKSCGSVGTCKPLKERRTELFSLFERLDFTPKNLSLLDSWLVNSYEEIWEKFNYYKELQLEGIMVKDLDAFYEFRRSRAILKLKVFKTMDLRIVGAEEGKATGKNSGTLGSLLLEGITVSGKCGTGYDEIDKGYNSDKTRDGLWDMYLSGKLTGLICEVVVQEVSKDNKLVICSFKGIRYDKTDVSEA